jgi:hypothetical protein
MAARNSHTSATWNREDRDLLVELRTEQAGTRNDLATIRTELKEINSGITARIINLELNAVSKIEIKEICDDVENLKQQQAITRTWGSAALLAVTILEFVIQYWPHSGL